VRASLAGLRDQTNGSSLGHKSILTDLLDALTSAVEDFAHLVLSFGEEANKWWILLDIGFAVLRGVVSLIVTHRSFDDINDTEFRAWLRQNGADEESIDSPPITGVYDLIFGYEDGNRNRPAVEAGTLLKTLFRMVLGYKDAPLWKMSGGMGDVVFSPLYEVLQARGVRFEFFRRVEELGLDDSQTQVARIRLTHQAALKDDAPITDYRPLTTVDGMPCWPSEPHWHQLRDGELLRTAGVNFESAWCDAKVGEQELLLGRDFDLVVLGIAVGALPAITQELSAASAPWREMLARTKTVQTQAAQLWLTKTSADLGWTHGETVLVADAPLVGSWADMSHLLARETWPAATGVRSIAYFCGVMPDFSPEELASPVLPAMAKKWVEGNVQQWVNDHGPDLWPKSETDAGIFNGSLLARLSGGTELQRWRAQYFRANVDPTERYVLTVPDSSRFRLAPSGSGFTNLFLAGDWTKTSVNGGCAEAAFESGVECARAVVALPASSTLSRAS